MKDSDRPAHLRRPLGGSPFYKKSVDSKTITRYVKTPTSPRLIAGRSEFPHPTYRSSSPPNHLSPTPPMKRLPYYKQI
ncbi:MAG: hypothetical protein AB2693_32530 [Candidatus Thiodiazotropha sp.]